MAIGILVGQGAPVRADNTTSTAEPNVSTTPSTVQSDIFRTLQMADATSGWSVQYITSASDGSIFTGVYRTQDGGKIWKNLTPSSFASYAHYDIVGFYFLDNANAWLALDTEGYTLYPTCRDCANHSYSSVTVWGTHDGGQSWQKCAIPLQAAGLPMFSFIDPQHGWLLVISVAVEHSSPLLMYRTTDGGLNWQAIADSGQKFYSSSATPLSTIQNGVTDGYPDGMIFSTAQDGWLLVTNGSSAMLHSSDGGRTWHPVSVAAAQKGDAGLSQCNPYLLQSGSAGISFLVDCNTESSHYGRNLVRSVDNGSHWAWTLLPPKLSVHIRYSTPDAQVYESDLLQPQIYMIDEKVGWAVGCTAAVDFNGCSSAPSTPQILYLTQDSGKTWKQTWALPNYLTSLIAHNGSTFVSQFDFIDDHSGWAIDNTGRLWATTDSGMTWIPLSPYNGLSIPTKATPDPTSSHVCSTGTPPRLKVGQMAHITSGEANNLRDSPSTSGLLLDTIPAKAEVLVLNGPLCDKQTTWWQVAWQNLPGWTVESDGKAYFMAPG